jgi:hypothetical protein
MGINAKAKYTLDKQYYEESYGQWLRYISRLRRLIPIIGVIAIIAAIVLKSYLLFALGIFYFIYMPFMRWRWIRSNLKNKKTRTDVVIDFSDDEVRVTDAFSDSRCSWDVFDRCIETPRGMFLFPEKRRFVYISDSSLEPPEAKKRIVDRLNKNTEQTGAKEESIKKAP